MDKSKAQYMEGDKLACPSCGKTEFCIGKDDIWTDGAETYADCTNCLTSTLTRLLKRKYHKDLIKDFDLSGIETVTITLECNTCGKTHTFDNQFKLYIYFGTMCDKIEPEPADWKCPDHPKSVVNMLIDTN